MESATSRASGAGAGVDRSTSRNAVRRLSTETKQAFKTTEFWAMVGVIVGILIAAAMIKGGDTSGTDEFIAKQAWLYVAIVAVGYMISRGLAKSGSREPYDADRDDDGR
jgi:di/tricarboxylate transporter